MSARQAPTSYGQRQLWFIDRLQGGSAEYNISLALRLKGKLDREALQRAFKTIVERHESLQTRFAEMDGEPVQVIDASIKREVLIEDLSNLDQPELHERIENAIRREAAQPFDLRNGPLVRMRLLQLGPEDHILLRTMHHIVSDAWSSGIFRRELKALYEAYQEGRGNPLPPLAVQYRDFAVWQRSLFENGQLDIGRQYWRKQLAGITDLELPTDRMRPDVLTSKSEICSVMLDNELLTDLKRLCKTHKATLYMTMLAAFGGLLSRYSGQDDIVVGSPVANRQDIQLEGLIGFFVNSLAMRMRVTEGITFRELLAQVRETVFDAYEHQEVPFEQIVKELSPRRNLNRTPVYQVTFGLQNVPPVTTELNGLKVEPIAGTENSVHFDLMVGATERYGQIRIDWAGRRDLFDKWSIERMAGHYVRLLQSVVTNVDQVIEQIDILTPEERRQTVYEWNATQAEYPREQLVHELFEEQVAKTPDAVTIVYEDATLSYGELNRRANQLAHYLRELGVGPDERVAICMERSLEMVVALLGVLKAGGAYVPLDPAYPMERLRYMLDDSEPVAVLTRGQTTSLFAQSDGPAILDLAEVEPRWREQPQRNLERTSHGLTPEHLAYVIYTSGSTGLAKGVMVEHRQLVNYVAAISQKVGVGEGWSYGLVSTFAADLGHTVLYASLLRGGALHVLPEAECLDGERFGRYCRERRLDCVKITPTHYQALLGEEGGAERIPEKCLVFGGEALWPELVQRVKSLRPGCRIYNHYGPTECTVGALSEVVAASSGAAAAGKGVIALGRPLGNMRVYVLDGSGEVAPVGVVGEIYIGGAGVARGYLQRAAVTAERFVSDPFAVGGSERMYQTGDLGRWKTDGSIEFVGRNDFQVKVRGYRVEPGEIEASLREHAGVREAVVLARADEGGEKRLVAYYTRAEENGGGEGIGAEELRQYLSAKLPEYMAPAAYVCLEKLPLTANGKLDRKALPEPETEAYGARAYEEPVGEIERAVAEIWADVLKVERVGRHDNFFELGGHSLLVMRVVSRLRKALNVDVTIRDVFEHPVLAELAAAVQQATPATLPPITPARRGGDLPLSFAQQRLWFLAQIGASEAYHIFYGWWLKGQLDCEALGRALDRIVARHEALRTTFTVIEGEPVQRIAAAGESRFHLVEHDLVEISDAETSLKELVQEEAASAFDLEAGPLIRGRLIRLGEAEHALLITMHHIVSDGWSMGVLMRELSTLYGAFARGEADPLPELSLQYADYAVWQRQWMEGEILRQQAEYWEQRLADAPTLLELPADHARPAEQEYAGGWVRVELDEELSRGLKELSKKHGMTLYMTLLAGWGALLARLSGQQEVVVGTPVANRGRVEIEGLIGFFVNTLALQLDVSGSPSVGELLEQVKEQTLAAQQHQDIPFEQVVELTRPARSLAHSPLFQVMFEWQHNAGSGLAMPGVELGRLGVMSDAVAQFDLMLSLRETGERIVGSLVYATSLFERATVERYLGYLRTLLEGMVADESQPIDRLPLLPEAERHQLLHEWNATQAEYPREKCVHELFEEQVEKTPDAVAVVYEEATLSYSELNRRANQLAHYLRELGVGPDERVAICAERSLEMIVGLLGVLKAGGAYVPLDPAYPVERLRYMVTDSAPLVLLTQARWQALFFGVREKLTVVDLDQGAAWWNEQPGSNPEWKAGGSGQLAYVIYTSGTTGTPKGVMVEQRGMVNHLCAKIRDLQLSEADVVAQTASVSFDISVWQFLAALLAGGQVQIVGDEEVHDAEGLLRVLDRTGVTVWETVPSLLEAIVGEERESWERLARLRWVVVTGEACPVGLCQRWRSLYPGIAMLNAYGPTECSDDVTHYALGPEWSGEALRQLPIGKPLLNTEVYVLDGAGEPAPVGVRGELYIGGEGVGRGYWQRPGLTGEKFVADGFGRRVGGRLYRTGDVGRWQAAGTLEFLGRLDHQVKIRGYRIELGEIEARLREHEAVQEAVVIEREDTIGDKRLVAYYSGAATNGAGNGAGKDGTGAEELRRHLSATLPEYMTPAAYVRLAELPLTANGKLDRKALPAPETDAYGVREYEEPQGEAERALAEIWAEVLKLERVGRRDNFFELGGHSLLVVRIIARLRQVGLDVDVRTLFVTPVLAELAAEIGSRTMLVEVPANGIRLGCEAITPEMLPLVQLTAEEIEKIVEGVPGGAANVQDIYPLAPLQEGILFHHLVGGENDPYIVGSLYSFDTRERLGSYLKAMQAVIDRHDILRTGVVWEGLPEPVQVVWRKAVLAVDEVVLEVGAGDGVAQLRERYNPRSYRMDVRRAPMLQVAVAHDEEEDRWLMMLLRHHLIGDHTTLEVMQEEIEACLLGQAERLPAPLPFRNLVAQTRLGISREEHEAYFRELLGEVEEPTAPFGLMNVQGDGTGIAQAQMSVEAGLGRRIRERGRKLGVSAASLCHVAWAQVAARTTGREDVVFGTTLFGRMQGEEGIERAVGLFMNTLPVRMRVGELGAEAGVREAHRQLAGLMRHEHASLALAQRCSGVPAPAPLFTSLLNCRRSARSGQASSQEKAQTWEGIKGLYGETRNNYPLNLAVDDLGEGFRLIVLVDSTVNAHRVCQYMHRALESLVEALESEPTRRLRALEVIPEAEKRELLYEWNATQAEYAREQLVHELFEEQVAKTPDAVAVVYEEATLSYGELNRRANQLAHYLRTLGVGPDERVALCLDRSLEMIVGLLGVLKAGGAYVPLDPAYPMERLRYMLDDSEPVAVLTRGQTTSLFAQSDGPAILDLGEAEPRWRAQPQSNPHPTSLGLTPEHLAYVIYTSGSTGRAKGVMVEHRQLVNYVAAISKKVEVAEGWSYGLVSTFAADLGHTVLYASLLRGGALHVLPQAACLDGERFGRYCRERRLDCVKITPTHYQALLGEEGGAERIPEKCLVFGGEALWPELVQRVGRLRPGCRVYNHYGPTECTVGALSEVVADTSGKGVIALGRPLGNMRVYVLDGSGEVAPVGVVGEIYIGGAGVARGYLSRAAVTAERFVSDPFAVVGSERMYRTGDLGKWQADGTIEFVGRNDFQVKVRGYRIELGEIEASLREHAGVREAVVLARADTSGDKRLVAYVTPEQAAAYPLLQGMRLEECGELEPGTRYELPNGMLISHQNKGETDFVYEEIFGRAGYMQHGITLAEDACVIDVGANIGLFTLYVLEQAPAASIYAFEPIPPVYENLRLNTTLSGGNVRLFNCGVSNTSGSANFAWYKHNSLISGRYADVEEEKAIIKAFIKNQKAGAGEEVSEETLEQLLEERLEYEEYSCPLLTLSEVIAAEGIERINLLKIDVQKSELEVLEGIKEEDWEKIRQVVVEVHDMEGRLSRIKGLLAGHGFLQAVEQEQLLETTNQYTVYARRASGAEAGDETAAGRSERSTKYWSAAQLTGALREHVLAKLPEYMAPAAYVYLEKLPLTANGKLDRKALPAPETEVYGARDYDEPVGETEKAVAKVWADVLKVERIGRHDNFFELGGHSLMVIRVVSRLRRALNVDVTIRDVFEQPVLADLAAALQGATPAALPPITRAVRGADLPLSFAQQRLWFLAQIGASEAYHIVFGGRLKGQLDSSILRRALDRIVARHEALRTTFVAIEGEPVQRIAAAGESRFHLLEHDLVEISDAETSLKELVQEEAASAFDLEAGPLIRGRLIRLGEAEHALLITMHHIVSDGWSMGVLIRELSTLYGTFARREEDLLPELEVQYADYAVWQRQWMEGEILRQQGEYWERRLAGAPTLLELPADHARPAEQEYAGDWVRVELDEELSRGLKELSKKHGMTLYMTLLAGWGTLLARLSGREDVVIGTPVANRGRVEIEGLIGFFVNTLALRLDVSGSPSVGELLAQVKEQTLAAQQHQDIPFEQVVELARPARSLAHSPLFQVMFEWQQNAGGGGFAIPDVELGPLGAASDVVAQFDLMLSLREIGERIVGSLVYATSLFERATVERYLGYLRMLLEGMVADERQAIDRLPLLPEAERSQLLYEWNATEGEYPRERCVQELFEEQVAKTPDAVAVVYEEATLSYSELNQRANRLAHYLRELGVGPDERVAICAERSLEMIVGLLGVLKAGGAYVPLDPAYPVERLRYMVGDSAPVVLLTQSQWQGIFSGVREKLAVVDLDQGAAWWSAQPGTNPGWAGGARQLAYVIYTSGTTGTPKGVMVEQRGMVNHLCAKLRDLQLSEADVVAQTASVSFDISVWQFLAALLAGGQVHIVGDEEVHDAEGLLRVLDRSGVTVWETVPSLLEAIVGEERESWERLAKLRWVVVTGEACPVGLCQRWRSLYPGIGMLNAYGPTECSDDVTHYAMEPEWSGAELRQLPIGRPLLNTEVYVLDGAGEPAPVGVRGELYIGGEGVGRGYWQRPGLTGERFVADRFGRREGARLYRTGDVGRWQAAGTLEFLGRVDHQVKIRGYRIELGEIEARLREHESVQEAVVIEREDSSGDKRLVAYYSGAARNGDGTGAEELRRHLSATLPEYMTPAAYVRLAELPLTANGKLDRKALPAPETDAYGVREYEEPQGEAERALAEIWADVLKVERVGRYDNFFELGGHSLLVVRVISRLRQVGLDVDVRTLFVTPVLAELAAALGRSINVVEVPPNPILELGKHRDHSNTIEIRL